MTAAVHRARRLTMWSLAFTLVLAWFGALAGVIVHISEGRADPVRFAVAGVALVVFNWYGWRFIRAVSVGWPHEARESRRYSLYSGIAVLVILLVRDADPSGFGMIAIAWVSVVTVRAGRLATVLLAAGTAVTCVLLLWLNPGVQDFPIGAAALVYGIMCLTVPYANKLWIWILDLGEQAHASKDAEARLAVTEERLRFARDLHDLVGHSLSVIAVKSELAGKLTTIDAARAAQEMAVVRGLAQDSLRQIREAVRGYRVLDLASELDSVRAILEADGVRCEIDLPPGAVDPETAAPFAWVVRESATNILRHSSATWCRVSLRAADGSAVLEVVNDGAATGSDPAGTGLAGLGERLAAIGGSLTAQPTGDGRFLVRATAPTGVAA
ncbi:histidine kinase [Actinoplanes capillaceus]|uniref:Histidine kinase n=1 Tax=Actinoplanes campanulatus TaxID=113559 RepID=A0ABQ3WS64_9ACTN|nr:histidine kinase [Actinoplanes capillaceus]GID49085.1 histidine kinase [Actinoplanes capillaceus]